MCSCPSRNPSCAAHRSLATTRALAASRRRLALRLLSAALGELNRIPLGKAARARAPATVPAVVFPAAAVELSRPPVLLAEATVAPSSALAFFCAPINAASAAFGFAGTISSCFVGKGGSTKNDDGTRVQ